MRMVLDCTPIRSNGKGISRFLVTLLEALAAADRPGLELIALIDGERELPPLPRGPALRYVRVRCRSATAWNLWGCHAHLKRIDFEVLFTISDCLATNFPYICYLFEIPDYRIEAARSTAPLAHRLAARIVRAKFPGTIRSAAHVVASSAATRDDLVRKYGMAERAITVVYPAPAPVFRPGAGPVAKAEARARFAARDGYLLHFSTNDPRENTGVVLRAFARSLERLGHRKRLLIRGSREQLDAAGWGHLIGELALEGRVGFVGFLDDAGLVALYRGADAYLDPSLYEGFGFQVAEALACGVPVICSNTTSLPELVGDAGLLVDPSDVAGFAEAIASVIADPARAAELGRRGLERSARFSWERTVAEIAAVAGRIAGHPEARPPAPPPRAQRH